MATTATADTTIKKISSAHSPTGGMGQTYLAAGTRLSMRLWEKSPEEAEAKPARSREYETVGFVLEGKAELHLEGQMVVLEPGDSWVVPAGASHTYKVLEPFRAVEATAPPAEVHGRDDRPDA